MDSRTWPFFFCQFPLAATDFNIDFRRKTVSTHLHVFFKRSGKLETTSRFWACKTCFELKALLKHLILRCTLLLVCLCYWSFCVRGSLPAIPGSGARIYKWFVPVWVASMSELLFRIISAATFAGVFNFGVVIIPSLLLSSYTWNPKWPPPQNKA